MLVSAINSDIINNNSISSNIRMSGYFAYGDVVGIVYICSFANANTIGRIIVGSVEEPKVFLFRRSVLDMYFLLNSTNLPENSS